MFKDKAVPSIVKSIKRKNGAYPIPKDKAYAHGGEVGDDTMVVCSPSSIASAIKAKKMAAGGLINEDTDMFSPAEEDDSDIIPEESNQFSPVEDPGSKRKRMLMKAFEMARKSK